MTPSLHEVPVLFYAGLLLVTSHVLLTITRPTKPQQGIDPPKTK